jgi:hypothetical protein
MQTQAIARQNPPKARRPAQWGLLLLGLTLFITLSLARFFFMGSEIVGYGPLPSTFTAIMQGINTQATITGFGEGCQVFGEPGKWVDTVAIQYQDLQHVTHSSMLFCALPSASIGEAVTIRYVPGYFPELAQDYQDNVAYYLPLGIIIAVQFLLAIPLIIIVVRTRPKRNAAPQPSVAV